MVRHGGEEEGERGEGVTDDAKGEGEPETEAATDAVVEGEMEVETPTEAAMEGDAEVELEVLLGLVSVVGEGEEEGRPRAVEGWRTNP